MEPSDVRVFTTPDVPGYKFVAGRGANLVYKVEGFENVEPAIHKITCNAKYIAAKEGYNCIIDCNPVPIPLGSTSAGSYYIINLNFTMGNIYN